MDARAIYQRHLDEISALLWSCDFACVAELIVVPNSVTLLDGTVFLEDRASVIDHLRTYRATLDRIGAEGYHRLCYGAQFDDESETSISGCHRSYTLRGGKHLTRPYESHLRLVYRGGQWLAQDLRIHASNIEVGAVQPEKLGPS